MDSEELGEASVEISGLRLWVHGYSIPNQCEDFHDGNWVRVTAKCHDRGARVRVDGDFIMTHDLDRFANRCEALHAGQSQEARFDPMEPGLTVTIRRTDSLGHFNLAVDITPDHMLQQHHFEFEIDQTYLPRTIEQVRAVLDRFPIRGERPAGD